MGKVVSFEYTFGFYGYVDIAIGKSIKDTEGRTIFVTSILSVDSDEGDGIVKGLGVVQEDD